MMAIKAKSSVLFWPTRGPQKEHPGNIWIDGIEDWCEGEGLVMIEKSYGQSQARVFGGDGQEGER